MKKEELMRNALQNSVKSKEEILENILTVVRKEENTKKQDDLYILILFLIKRKDMYGYEIIKEMSVKSKGTFAMSEGELYPILHYLENQGFIDSYWVADEEVEKKFYKLARKGKGYLKNNVGELNKFSFLSTELNLQKIN